MKMVYLKKESNGIPEGSGINVTKETKTKYYGIWSSMVGTYNVWVYKKDCR